MSAIPTILAVDNDPQVLAVTARILIGAGYEVLEASTGQDCLDLVGTRHPDLVLLDIVLPDINGLEVCRRIKADPALAHQFVVMASATQISSGEQSSGLESGADGYIVRPIGNRELLARVEAFMRIISLTRSLREKAGELEKINASLRESEEKFAKVFHDAPVLFAITDAATGAYVEVNEESLRVSGFTREEVIGRTGVELGWIGQEDRSRMLKQLQGQDHVAGIEMNFRAKGGGLLSGLVHTQHISVGGRPCLLTVTVDITERRQAEENIRSLTQLLELAQDAIAVRDLKGGIRYWNKSNERLIGMTAAQAMGKTLDQLVKVDAAAYARANHILLEKGQWSGELNLTNREGRAITLMARWTLVRDEQGQPKSVLVIATDVTEQKKLESQFLRAQRMESIGTLASGIAHDMNNILAPIMMSAPLLRENTIPEDREELVKLIESNARRGAGIVKQLLTFGRGVSGEKVSVQFKHLIKEMIQVAEETFPKNLAIKSDVATNLWPMMGNATQMHQVLLNLCINARDAMPDGGVLLIKAENVRLDEQYTRMNRDAKPGPYVHVEVSDTGVGIPAENLEKIFDPFFTTKEVGKGTGLGLSTVIGIIRSHDGFIQVRSITGQGATFEFFLPADPEGQAAASAPASASLPQSPGELILVVDDESNIRAAISRTLEKQGYRVLLAEDGTAAVAAFALHADDIQLVLTDLMMPHMDGQALARTLLRLKPGIKIAISSGRSSGLSAAEKAELNTLGVKLFLSKPYASEQLLTALHNLLHPKPAGEY